jgi:hypothetical protein
MPSSIIKIELVRPEDRANSVKSVEKVVARRSKTGKQEVTAHSAKMVLRRIRCVASGPAQAQSERWTYVTKAGSRIGLSANPMNIGSTRANSPYFPSIAY